MSAHHVCVYRRGDIHFLKKSSQGYRAQKVERNYQICIQFTTHAYLKSYFGLDLLPTIGITYGYRNHRITPSELSIMRGGDSKKQQASCVDKLDIKCESLVLVQVFDSEELYSAHRDVM